MSFLDSIVWAVGAGRWPFHRSSGLRRAVACFLLASASGAAAGADTIIDNAGAGVTFEGAWSSGAGSGSYNSSFSFRTTDGRVTYRPSIAPGRYSVSMWWAQDVNQSIAVPVGISTHQGWVPLTVNQSVNGGQWNLLGTYDLDKDVWLTLTVNGSKRVCADAVKFSTVAPANPPPAAPTGVTAVASGDNVLVRWNANTETDLKGYSVFRSNTPGGPYSWNAREITTTSRTDNWIVGNSRYYYVVIASDQTGGLSLPSGEVSVTSPLPPLTILNNGGTGTSSVGTWATVTGSNCYGGSALTASGTGSYTFAPRLASGWYRIQIWWNKDWTQSTAVPIVLQTSGGATATMTCDQSSWGGQWNVLTIASLDVNSTVKINVQGALKTCADAVRFEQLGAPSPNLPPSAPAGVTATARIASVHLDWNDNPETDLASYSVYRSTTSGSGFQSLAGGLTSSVYDDFTAAIGTTYYYMVFAVDTGGQMSNGSTQVSARPLDRVVNLAWNAPTLNQNGTPLTDLAGYKLYRGTQSGVYGTVTALGLVTQQSVNLSPGLYFFRVTACDLRGNESTFSNEISYTMP